MDRVLSGPVLAVPSQWAAVLMGQRRNLEDRDTQGGNKGTGQWAARLVGWGWMGVLLALVWSLMKTFPST